MCKTIIQNHLLEFLGFWFPNLNNAGLNFIIIIIILGKWTGMFHLTSELIDGPFFVKKMVVLL